MTQGKETDMVIKSETVQNKCFFSTVTESLSTNSDFLIPIYLQPNVVDFRFFKL